MKKLFILAALLLPCVPSLIAGLQSQKETDDERKAQMLDTRFKNWCTRCGYKYGEFTEREKAIMFEDVWAETDDFINAVDSVDSVLSLSTALRNNM